MRQIHKLSILIVFLCLFAGPCKGQKLYKELLVCGNLLQERRSDMYDDIENYLLNEVDKDSIRNVPGIDILYNLDMGFLYSVKYNDEEKAIPYLDIFVYHSLLNHEDIIPCPLKKRNTIAARIGE